ncbi:hypothetical protein CRUP_008062 [Coryphaenoides rupestris]|nr:hypothetical protein CRUP_008062 [Coryphaenoides rupestris]
MEVPVSGKISPHAATSISVTVQEPFVDRLAFGEDSPSPLWNSSIVFRDVRPEDESCYRCLFSGHPDGVLTANTCLRVSEPPKSTLTTSDGRKELLLPRRGGCI